MMPEHSAGICSPLFQEVEKEWLSTKGPAVPMRRERVIFEATSKAFNMSAAYATTFGSGAGEHIQNWWDECRVKVTDRRPSVCELGLAESAAIAQRYKLTSGVQTFAACHEGSVLGIVLACTTQTGSSFCSPRTMEHR